MTTSAMSVVLLRGKYETGDFYTDRQYHDFSTAFTTMFIYLASGENFIEATSEGIKQSLWYSAFFMSISLVGLFFITALLIEAFSESYYENKKVGAHSRLLLLGYC